MIFLVFFIFSTEYSYIKNKAVSLESKSFVIGESEESQTGIIEKELEYGVIQSHVIKASGAATVKIMDSENTKTIETDELVDFREGEVSRDVSYSVIKKNKIGDGPDKRVIVIHNKILGNGDRDRAMIRDREVLKNI